MTYDRLSPESPIDDNIALLAKAFPSVVREGKVDFDALRQLLGNDIGEPHELYGLNWKGKAQARRAALTPSLGTLRPCPAESVDWDSTKNLYIEGDNLEVLKLLRKSYSGKVKMIYIDPPYNTGKEFVYPDDYQSGIDHYKKLTEQEETFPGNVESSGRFHTDWLNMMYPRLMLARDLLCEDGVIFISIDDCEMENLCIICNEIWGERNFISCFVWNCSTAGGIRPRFASKTHEYIFCYAKNIDNIPMFFAPLSEDAIKMYKQRDERGVYRDKDFVFKNKSTNSNQKYIIECPDGEKVKPKDGYIYRFVRERYQEALSAGLVSFKQTRTGPLVNEQGQQAHWNIYIKKYLGDAVGAPSTLISREMMSIYNAGTQCVQELFDGVRVFENVKPVNVVSYFINLIAKEGIILDFFSGSATTAHAVMQMNAEDGGKRRFIMVQLPEPCDRKSEAYKAGYKNICEIGKERIRRAGKKLKEEAGLMGQGLDTGFRVYKLDSSNVKPWNPDAEDLDASLDLFSEHLVEGRTSDDLLTEVMLKSGIDLCEEMETREIAGHRVYSLGYGQFYACMDLDLSGAEGELALGIAAWHAEECAAVGGEQQDTCTVFVADQAFAGRDDAKMNFVSTLQQYGICKVKAL